MKIYFIPGTKKLNYGEIIFPMIAKIILSNDGVFIQSQYLKIDSLTSTYEEAIVIAKKDCEMLIEKNNHLKNYNDEVAFIKQLIEIKYSLYFAGNKKVEDYIFLNRC